MKAYCAAASLKVLQTAISRSKWDAQQLSNGNFLAVLENPSISDVQRAQKAGAQFLPPLNDPETKPSAEFMAMIPKEAGLTGSETPWQAAKKLYAHTEWKAHNPARW